MFGKNPKLQVTKGDGSILHVHNVFKTLQGEGPFVGRPAVFVRLYGCNLACTFCDTNFEDNNPVFLKDLLCQIEQLRFAPVAHESEESDNYGSRATKCAPCNLVVITGGEPLRQPIERLCEELINSSCNVQIETNGIIFRELPKETFIVISPKNESGTGKNNVDNRWFSEGLRVCLKILVSQTNEKYSYLLVEEYLKVALKENIEIFLQPMDEYNSKKNSENTAYATYLSNKYNLRLSIQTHKILKIS